MSGFGGFGAIKSKATGAFSGWNTTGGGNYEEFGISKEGDDGDAANDASSPDSIPEPDRPPLRHIDKYIRPECPCLTKRVTVALLTCMGFIVMFGMRCNMGIAKLKIGSEFNQSLAAVDSSIFIGYLVTQVPGGFLAAKYPANKLFGGAIGTSSFLNLLVPGALILGPGAIIIVRVLQGLVEGVTYPACHGIWRYWAPPLERSRLATLAFCGCYAGVMFGMPLGGELIKRIGWQAPFYFYGCFGITWYLMWLWLVFEKPSKHPTIEARELKYIETSLGESGVVHVPPTIANTPWKKFFTSLPVWAIFVANFCRSWNFYLLVVFQATYVSKVYNIDIEENAIVGALPHLLMTIIVPSGGVLADHLRKKGILTTTQVRKIFNCGGFGMEATFFLVVAFSKTYAQAITALTFGVAFSGFAISGFNVNHLDIAPKYASILMGMSNGIGTIAGCIVPLAVHSLTDEVGEEAKAKGRTPIQIEEAIRSSWSKVFILGATVHFLGVLFYGLFASGELQPWADPQSAEEKQWNPMDETVQFNKSPTGQSNGLVQTSLSGKTITYGSVDDQAPPPPPQRPQLPQIPPQVPPPPYQQPPANPANPFMAGPVAGGASNPFNNPNPFRTETVQPQPEDRMAHMYPALPSEEDRNY